MDDLTEGLKLFLSPLAELFGASPYTPSGYSQYGNYERTNGGVEFISNEADRRAQLMDFWDTSWS